MKDTFIIKYEVQFTDGSGLLGKELKAKNCKDSIHAQVELEKYLRKKYPNFKALIVNDCEKDFNLGNLGFPGMPDFSSIFGAGFGGKK